MSDDTPTATAPAVGAAAPPLRHALTRADLVRYAGASGDFHPLHTDDAFARSAGLPGVCAHGMFGAGLLATAITRWLGVGALRRYKIRFVAKAWPGEVLQSYARLTEVRREGDQALVEFECRLAADTGEVKIIGSGTALVVPVGADPANQGEEPA